MYEKWLGTRSVIPTKAGIQATFLWIPACTGKTIVTRMSHDFADAKLFTAQYTSVYVSWGTLPTAARAQKDELLEVTTTVPHG